MRALLVLALALACVAAPRVGATGGSFEAWLADLLAEARGRGFDDELLDRTLVGLTPLPRVIASDRAQPEAVLTFERYVSRRLTPAIVRRGRELAQEHRDLLERVRDAYGVPAAFVLAIWGLESQYGRFTGDVPVFQALATLAWDGRRAPFFRAQLYDALRMVDRAHIDPPTMSGSWAGAMGQPQFLPSSYLAYAVDFDGDGRRDIWTSYADTFASIANYLKRHGWREDEPWGREVRVTPPAAKRVARAVRPRRAGCRAMRDMLGPVHVADWRRLGVRGPGGEGLPADAREAALVRAGRRRFLVHGNYDVILHYNCAHHYALTVGLLAQRLGDGE